MRFQSIRFKASVLYSAILAAILIIFSSVIFISVRNILYREVDEELRIKAGEVANILYAYEQLNLSQQEPLERILDILRIESATPSTKMIIDDIWRAKFDAFNLKDDYINILNIRGGVLLNSNNMTAETSAIFKEQFPFSPDEMRYQTLATPRYAIRVINLPISFGQIQLVVQVGTPMEQVAHILDKMLLFMTLTVIVLLALTSFMGSIFMSNALRPVRNIASLANKITHKDLSVRIEEKQLDEEMRVLVDAFNVMINRLDNAFSHISEFSSHVAHELKTPLAIMRGEIELALEENQRADEYKRVLYNCLEETDRMIKVTKDLLLLAKLDYKPEILKYEKIDLQAFLREIYHQSKILADPKNIAVHFNQSGQPLGINADKVHLRRLFLNLINNAVAYTPEGGRIDISVEARERQCCVQIKDTGEGISEENLKKVFTKFFRVQQSRDDDGHGPGSGLGLNIALSIARAHRGDITVTSKPGQGSTFSTSLPLSEK